MFACLYIIYNNIWAEADEKIFIFRCGKGVLRRNSMKRSDSTMLKPQKLGKTTRLSFSKINEALEMPNLIEVQKKSFEWKSEAKRC